LLPQLDYLEDALTEDALAISILLPHLLKLAVIKFALSNS